MDPSLPMNKIYISTVKEITKGLNINDMGKVIKLLNQYATENPSFNSFSLQLAFICIHFKENEEKSNLLILDLIPNLQIQELVIAFNKMTRYSDAFIEYCKKFSNVRQLRPVILEIFKKLKITYEEGGIYCFEEMDEIEKEPMIERLFKCINTNDFKRNKDVIAPLIRRYSHLIPELNETGYRNLNIIKCTDIFLYDYSAIHPSETIRLQYFKLSDDFVEIFVFLKFNQILINSVHRNEIISVFNEKLKKLSGNKELFPIFVDLILNGIVKSMCVSSDLRRRHLGTGLLVQLGKFVKNPLITTLINELIYDVNSSIRDLAARLSYLNNKPESFHLQNLISHEYPKIKGASIFLEDYDSEALCIELKSLFEAGNENIYGIMHLLNIQTYKCDDYGTLVDLIYKKYSNINSVYSWRILEKCCMFFINCERYDELMNILLSADHLGLICAINDAFNLPKNYDISKMLEIGLESIIKNNKNIRKSGGLPIYFLKLINQKENFLKVKTSLFNLIGSFKGGLIHLNDSSENILFNTLNIFSSFQDKCTNDMPFYFLLGFSCLNHPLFTIKNCGFDILSSVFEQITLDQPMFDTFFNINNNLRICVLNILKIAILSRNHHSIYFCLLIYQRVGKLTVNERNEIQNCKNHGELITLKANSVLNCKYDGKQKQDNNFAVSDDFVVPLHVKFLKKLKPQKCHRIQAKINEITNILISLNSFEIINLKKWSKKHKILYSSSEYLMYQISVLIKKMNISNDVINCIEEYADGIYGNYLNEEDLNDKITNSGFEYLLEILKS